VVALFFGFGLLLAFTPCVFPMIPILSGIIAGQGASITTRRAFALSLTYLLGMALMNTLAGVAAAAAGRISGLARVVAAIAMVGHVWVGLDLSLGLRSGATSWPRVGYGQC
jgi:thiol:disulfide interchange protein DsbD